MEEYTPTTEEQEAVKTLDRRIREMKDYRKNLGVEKEWREADQEYVPSSLIVSEARKRFEQDQDTGLRSRMVKITGDEDSWRSDNSDPVLLSKIQSALSIIIDRDPKAVMTALIKKYEKTSPLMNGLWKRNWKVSGSKHILKLFVFNLAKYGWAVRRAYPFII